MGSSQVWKKFAIRDGISNDKIRTYLGESTVVPDVPVVGKAVADISQPALLDILLDGVEGLVGGHLHFCVGPTGDLDDHVEDAIVLVGKEWDVVERRHDRSILLDEHTMLCDVVSWTSPIAKIDECSPRVFAAPSRRGVYSYQTVSFMRSKEQEGAHEKPCCALDGVVVVGEKDAAGPCLEQALWPSLGICRRPVFLIIAKSSDYTILSYLQSLLYHKRSNSMRRTQHRIPTSASPPTSRSENENLPDPCGINDTSSSELSYLL